MRYEDMEYLNYRGILDAIEKLDGPSRAQIAKALGLSKTTVSNVVNDLIEDGIVEECDTIKAQRGRPGLILRLKKGVWYALGASFMGSRWSFVITDLDGKVVEEYLSDGIQPFTVSNFLDSLVSGLRFMMSKVSGKLLPAIGLGLPGVVDVDRGRIMFANDLLWHDPVDVAEYVGQRIPGFSVYATNRYTASGIAEYRYANPDKEKDLVYVGIGSGIRSAIFINGNLLVGSSYSAGRIAHMIVEPDGEICDCGKRGCLLTVASSSALVKNARMIRTGGRYPGSGISEEKRNISLMDIAILADSGDEGAKAAVDMIVGPLSRAISEIIEIVNPNRIVIGGPLGYSCTYLVSEIENKLKDKISKPKIYDVEIVQGKLRQVGSSLGSASLVLDRKAELLFNRK